jgi:hypothetical protein
LCHSRESRSEQPGGTVGSHGHLLAPRAPSLRREAGNPDDQERRKDIAHDPMKIKIISPPTVEIDLVVLLAQPNDRQQHIEAVNKAIRHAVYTTLAREPESRSARTPAISKPATQKNVHSTR